MSDPEDQNTPQEAETTKWYLRIDEDSLYGPVVATKLREWAQQGRVAPGNEISSDREQWIPAEDLPELEMVWNVELDDGTFFGPLNIKALRDLLEDETITFESRLVNRSSGETASVGEKEAEIYAEEREAMVAAALAEQQRENVDVLRRLQSKLRESFERLDEARRNCEEEKRQHAETRDTLAEREGQINALQEQLATEQQRLADLETQDRQKAEELGHELETLRAECQRLTEEAGQARAQLEGEQASHAETRQSLDEARRECGATQTQQTEAQASLGRVEQQLAEEKKAHEGTRKTLTDLQQALDSEKSGKVEYQGRLQHLESELSRERTQLADTTRHRDELVREIEGERNAHSSMRTELEKRDGELAQAMSQLQKLEASLQSTRSQSDTALEESLQREQDLTRKLVNVQQESAENARALTDAQQQLAEAVAVSSSVKTLEKQLDQERRRNDELSKIRETLEQELLSIKSKYETELETNRDRIEQLLSHADESSPELVIPELVVPEVDPEEPIPEPPKQTSSALADLEAQAQRELKAWQNSRRRRR